VERRTVNRKRVARFVQVFPSTPKIISSDSLFGNFPKKALIENHVSVITRGKYVAQKFDDTYF
jgi:hypothetical protein